ncbi:hypothetical protein BU25DRAFT_178630 [Macroventuria anomochaeta]|uniref:Uncharacterized protein n=1 Tax=Macroventuria anomochaeta TaxID=301207 RepID=A0ACB6RNM3_9PLEO|nr:uncharacterized protein BU25DRAFT_178630 [Macroventuria anomochaeta]KAF2623403.1 hypothetical protein BU25DRAFT_178630 [Macroventuria anomochaeta]
MQQYKCQLAKQLDLASVGVHIIIPPPMYSHFHTYTFTQVSTLTARPGQLSLTASSPFFTPEAPSQGHRAVCTCAATKTPKSRRLPHHQTQTHKLSSFQHYRLHKGAQDNDEPQRCANKQIRAGRSGNHATVSAHKELRFFARHASPLVMPWTVDRARFSPCISPP